jgi:hypothetical protein
MKLWTASQFEQHRRPSWRIENMARRASVRTTKQKAAAYQVLTPQLTALQSELKDLARKRPDATLSTNKVAFINRLLADIKDLLKDEGASKFLDLLDDQALPQFSDAVLIVSQYSAALDAFHSRYFGWNEETGEDSWFTS